MTWLDCSLSAEEVNVQNKVLFLHAYTQYPHAIACILHRAVMCDSGLKAGQREHQLGEENRISSTTLHRLTDTPPRCLGLHTSSVGVLGITHLLSEEYSN